jgi:glycosyltransferase involved in cell wall biosynthesis
MSILVAGYPYVRKNFSEVFKYFSDPSSVYLLLPKEWKIKDGKVIYHPEVKDNVSVTKSFFHHSNYPIVGGLLKGWLPALPWFLYKNRNLKFKVLFTATEPMLISTLYQGFWAKLFGLKHVVFTWENIPYEEKFHGFNGWFKKAILKLNFIFSDAVICGNQKAERIVRGLTKKPTAVIPLSGVDTDFFSPRLNPKIFKGKDLTNRFVFSFMGSISYRKGIHVAIQSFKQVLNKFPDSHFIIAGSGEYEKEIDSLVDVLNLKDHVSRFSWLNHEEARDLFSVSGVFLYPSIPHKGWEEQFGYSVVEAESMGVPVVATRSGSFEEVIEDNRTGILVKSESVEELRDSMLLLQGDLELRKNMSLAAREFVMNNFSHKSVAKKMEELFYSICE